MFFFSKWSRREGRTGLLSFGSERQIGERVALPIFGGILATIVTALALTLADPGRGQINNGPSAAGGIGELSAAAPADHAGSTACAECHPREHAAWRSSHHARAMAQATPETIRGDFSGLNAAAGGATARFFRDGDRFLVETEGRDGKPAVFAVSHSFGLEPLQQYLVTFPDGRLQALPWAWDTRPREAGGQRWFHVYGDDPVPPSDSRHWTRYLQTWNHMCAECHSTALDKGYDAANNTYRTTWSEISVGCEACHGGGRAHVAWAREGAKPGVSLKGFAAAAAVRGPGDWAQDPATGSPKAGVARQANGELETCGRCHSRRGQVWPVWAPGRPLADTHRPALLTPELFEDDGQMKDEVFNDHSFRQSLMFEKGVTCGDCHDVHSGSLKANGAAVCGQCHAPSRFGQAAHTGHAAGPTSPTCIDCHMPARTYMVVDRRHDHSFRIPRPDLTASLGTPNTCSFCHSDRPASWAAEAVERWHGPVRKGHQTYAAAFSAARRQEVDAGEKLLAVARDSATPAVARATAIGALAGWPSIAADDARGTALSDPDPLVRMAAVGSFEGGIPDVRRRRLIPLLADPVRTVRLAATAALADQSPESLPAQDRAALLAGFAEYEAALRLDADRPEGRAAMARFRLHQGRVAEAEAEYLAALRLEPTAVAVSVNLADLYRQTGREAAAEQTLRAAIMLTPDAAAPRHVLGLALVRARRIPEAIDNLAAATRLDPGNDRFAYVYGVALNSTGRQAEASAVWRAALQRNPASVEILSALLQQAIQSQDAQAARSFAETLAKLRPDDPEFARLAARFRSSP